MKVPASSSGERLVQEYLTRVAAAARHLPKGARITFVGRTRAQIEREIGDAGMADPGRVVEALAALGEPEDLVQAERMRIDQKWARSRSRGGAAAAADDPAAPQVIRPGRLTARWAPPGARPPVTRTPVSRPVVRKREPKPARTTKPFTRTRGISTPQPAEVTPPAEIAPPPGAAPPPDALAPPEVPPPPEPESTAVVPPPWPGDLDAMIPPGGDSAETHGETPLDGLWRLSREHVRESVAVVLIGLCGAILPFPFWLAGAAVAIFSRLWDKRDKFLAWGGPVLVVFAGSVLSALLTGGNANIVLIYTHALHASTGLWVRIGCVLTALYLAWRVYQGPRVKVPPWKR